MNERPDFPFRDDTLLLWNAIREYVRAYLGVYYDGDAAVLASGSDALGSGARVRANTVSLGSTQLRVDPDVRWWRFHADDELGWVLVDGPSSDPADLVNDPG